MSARTARLGAPVGQGRRERFLALVYVAIVTIGLFLFLRGWGYDDSYITFRYIQNLALGEGFVYNLGQRTLSTTAPLFALALSLPASLGLDIPILANFAGCLALALGGLLLWDIAGRLGRPIAGVFALLLYPTYAGVTWTISSEMPVFLLFCLAGLASYFRRRDAWSGFFLALAALTRADGLVLAAILATDRSLRIIIAGEETFPRLLAFARTFGLALAAALLPWIAFGFAYFGSPLPVTLAAKQAQGLLPNAQNYLVGLSNLVNGLRQAPVYWIAAALYIYGLVAAVFRQRRWLVFFAWPAAIVMAYGLLGIPRAFWYYGALAPGLALGSGLALDDLVQGARALRSPAAGRIAVGLASLFILLTFVHQALGLWQQRQNPDPRLSIFRDVGLWLDANTREDAAIGLLEFGIIGYHAYPRPIVEFSGLLYPEIAALISADFLYSDTALWAAERFQPDYFVLPEGHYDYMLQEYGLARCELLQVFPAAAYGVPDSMLVYGCQKYQR